MAASLPGSTAAENLSNPSAGRAVVMSPFSGPKGSPFSGRTITGWSGGRPTYAQDATNVSTGALSTGIGFGSPPIIGLTAPQSIKDAGFNDNYTPGITLPNGNSVSGSALLAIGGGRSGATVDGIAPGIGYNAQPLLMAGNGGSRDAGAGPVFTGFGMKMVTATGAVATGAAIETGFVNRTGVALVTGQSAFGSSTTASPAVT